MRIERGAQGGQVQVTTTIRKPLTCRLNLHHRWRWLSTEDGGRYEQCEKCGKDRDKSRGVSHLTGLG